MPSGFGYTGGRSRCFAHWQEFQKCYAQTETPVECRPQANDYIECLHHPKELARAKLVQDELTRQTETAVKEGRKTADVLADGAIVGVGLIQRSKHQDESAK